MEPFHGARRGASCLGLVFAVGVGFAHGWRTHAQHPVAFPLRGAGRLEFPGRPSGAMGGFPQAVGPASNNFTPDITFKTDGYQTVDQFVETYQPSLVDVEPAVPDEAVTKAICDRRWRQGRAVALDRRGQPARRGTILVCLPQSGRHGLRIRLRLRPGRPRPLRADLRRQHEDRLDPQAGGLASR